MVCTVVCCILLLPKILSILLIEEVLWKMATGIVLCHGFYYSLIHSSNHGSGLQLAHLSLILLGNIVEHIVCVLGMGVALLMLESTVVASVISLQNGHFFVLLLSCHHALLGNLGLRSCTLAAGLA